jgi:uncharacterized protein
MLQIGKINTLEVYKFVDFGVYLDGEQYGPILLPKRYVPEDIEVEDEIDVFIYLDSEDRIIATTETPKIKVGEFAFLKAKQVDDFGAFLDWGLMKDLFVPFREQKMKMIEGHNYWVYAFIDKQTDRIVGSAKVDRYLSKEEPQYEIGDEVTIQIHSQTDLGYKAIVDSAHWGVLYANEVFQDFTIGQTCKAYIKKVREDFKIDLSLQKLGYIKVDDVRQQILNVLKENNGFLGLHDKSPAEEVQQRLGISKKAYKMTIGALYKSGRIIIEENGIRLV